jgi:hypothetical protein
MTELRKTESELDEGLRLGPLLWPQKMAAELRRLHEENQALRTALAYTEQDLAYQEAKRLQALRTALAQPEQWKTCRHCGFDYRPPKANKWFPLAQTEQECIYPDCETGIGCDGPCGEKPVDTVKQEPAVYKCPRCATSMDVDLNAKPVDTINTSQERETAKCKHEPVAWHEPGAYGNVTTHKDWALANGWEPLYKEKKT